MSDFIQDERGRFRWLPFRPVGGLDNLPDPAAMRGYMLQVDEPQIQFLYSDGVKWIPLQSTTSAQESVTVGDGGDFEFLQDAVNFLIALGPAANGRPHSITILADTVLTEQVRVNTTAGFINIFPETDDPILWDVSEFEDSFSSPDFNWPAAFTVANASSPNFYVQFHATGTFPAGAVHGLLGLNATNIAFYLGSYTTPPGFSFFDTNLRGGNIEAYRSNFDDANGNGIIVQGPALLSGVNARRCGTRGMLIRAGGDVVLSGASNDAAKVPIDPIRNVYQKTVGVNDPSDIEFESGGKLSDQAIPAGGAFGSAVAPGTITGGVTFFRDGVSNVYEGVMRVTQYTVATVPSAADNAGVYIDVTDGDEGNPCLARSDGVNWRVVGKNTVVSAT